jgi:hypothetical protein
MQLWLEICIFGAFLGFLALLACVVWLFLQFREIAVFAQSVAARKAEIEAEELAFEKEKHEDLSARGRYGVQRREENKEMRAAAMQEGRALMGELGPELLTNPEAQARAKDRLIALTVKYPRVAEEVADRLIYEFHAEPYKDLIMQVVGQALQAHMAAPTAAPAELAY